MAERVRVLLTEEEVDARIQEIGDQISKDLSLIHISEPTRRS